MAIPNRAPADPLSPDVRCLVARYFGADVEPRLDVTSDPESPDPELAVVVIPTSFNPAEANARLDELVVAADGLNVVFDVAYAWMPFAWVDFLALARTLADGDEAARRTAVSRAYYAAFNVAKGWADGHGLAGSQGGPASHWQVWTYFRHRPEPDLRRAGAFGQALRRRRIQADYDEAAGPGAADAQDAILKAERILAAFPGP